MSASYRSKPSFRSCTLKRATVLAGLCLGLPAAANGQAFNFDDAERYAADRIGVPAFLAGFDSVRIATKKVCARAPSIFTDSDADDFESDFRHVSTVDEIFEEEKLAVGVRVGVKYMGIGASVDSRYGHVQSKASEFRHGAIYGYAEKIEPIRFISAPTIELNDRGRRLHDEAVRKRDMSIFHAECGDQILVGRQGASYVQVIGTMNFSSTVDEETQDLAIAAAVKVATGVLDVSAETTIEQEKKEIEAFEKLEVRTSTIASANPPGCPAPNQTIESATDFFRCYTQHGAAVTKDLHAVYAVPYSEVIDGFGQLPEGSLAHDRQDDVETILNGLTILEMAIFELERLRETAASPQPINRRLRHLRKDYRRAVAALLRNDGCLAVFSLGCENLFLRFRTFPAASQGFVNGFVRKMLQGGGSCPSRAWPVFNRNGIAVCRSCGIGEVPVFLDGKNGACGFVAPEPEANVVRLSSDDLVQTSVETVELVGGGFDDLPVTRHLDVCAARDVRCGRRRATGICQDRGFARAVRWVVAPHSPTVYGDGNTCSVVDNFDDPAPAQCRTYGFLDCRCPKGEFKVGTTCVLIPPVVVGVDHELQLNVGETEDADDDATPPGFVINDVKVNQDAFERSPIFELFGGFQN